MKIIIIGGNGLIGCKVSAYFKRTHEIITAGRSNGDVNVDITKSDSIQSMFEKVGAVDAIVCIAGEAKWEHFDKLSEEDYFIGIKSKLMGQVNVVRIGKNYLIDNGSITLSTGILADHPVRMTTSAAMVNGGIHSFVKAVVLETKRGIRINAVALGVVADAYEQYKDYFPGHSPISMEKVADAYAKSIEGTLNGAIIKVYT